MKKTGLGRGLEALLPDSGLLGGVTWIELTQIDTNSNQPRRAFEEDALRQLADSIREAGVLQPLLVVEAKGRYRIVAGERRFRAARMAGLSSVPCIVREWTAGEQMEASLIENLQREDLNPMEEAAGVRALMDECGYTQEKASQRLGKSRPAVANLLRLLTLPGEVRDMVTGGLLSAGHARVLAGLENDSVKTALARRAAAEGLSVRELELLAARPAAAPRKSAAAHSLAPELADLENRVRDALGVRATLTGTTKRGRIVLNYYTFEELERIYKAMERLAGD
jgi:ParB family transcriptional regulator, chromosome partitioning protein